MIYDPSFVFINKIILSVLDIAIIGLILWVYSANPKNKLNQSFSLMTLTFLLWLNGGYFFSFSNSLEFSLWLGRMILGVVSISFTILYFFITIFPYETKRNKILDSIVILLAIFFMALPIFTDLVVKDVKFTKFGIEPIFGKGEILYYGWLVFLMVLILIQIFKKYSKISKEMRIRFQYFLAGFSILVLMNLIFNVFLPIWRDSIQFWQFGNYSIIFFLGFTAYAILKRELFGIKLVLTTLLVGLIATLLLFDIFILTEEVFVQFFKGLLLIVFLYFGYLLIRSVLKEIALRVELEKAYKELKKLDVAKSEFISIASHQLRTPLTAIKGYISLINEKIYGKPPKRMNRPLKNIYTSTERLIKLVSDLLNISRIEAGKIKLKIEKVKLEDIIDSVVAELKNLAKEKKLYLKWEKPKTPLPKVLVDKDRIRQVILNVVDNGIRYTERGGVTIRYRKGNKICKLIVSDTGEGMTKKEISNLFRSFTRGSIGQSTWTEGTGLGLYIAKKFIDLHNGRIWAKSPGKGKGSTFYIKLPTA